MRKDRQRARKVILQKTYIPRKMPSTITYSPNYIAPPYHTISSKQYLKANHQWLERCRRFWTRLRLHFSNNTASNLKLIGPEALGPLRRYQERKGKSSSMPHELNITSWEISRGLFKKSLTCSNIALLSPDLTLDKSLRILLNKVHHRWPITRLAAPN